MFEIFVEETSEHLTALDEALIALKAAPADKEALQRAFRSFHTIASAGATMGYSKVETFGRKVEALLNRVRSGEIEGSAGLTDLLLRMAHTMKELLRAVGKGRAGEFDADGPIKELEGWG